MWYILQNVTLTRLQTERDQYNDNTTQRDIIQFKNNPLYYLICTWSRHSIQNLSSKRFCELSQINDIEVEEAHFRCDRYCNRIHVRVNGRYMNNDEGHEQRQF